MKNIFSDATIVAVTETEAKAASFLNDEIELRIGKRLDINNECKDKYILLKIDEQSQSEDFTVECSDNGIKITAHRLRGLIYGYSYFIRKTDVKDGNIYLIQDITGNYSPSMKIRGHQLGYTHMNNTYDAWSFDDFDRYIRDMMFFGTNTVEATTEVNEERNDMMQYSTEEMLSGIAKICRKYDLDYSVFRPLTKSESDDEAVESMKRQFACVESLDILFPPGGDPGDLLPENFVERCKKMKNESVKKYPSVEMWPSMQAPHEYPDWGERFAKKMNELPQEIDGLIYGPNHAMPLDEMRRKIDMKYPIRFYPDITHNVRSEVPVHFNREDWHYAFASTLSRESVNPRPSEYRLLHRLTRQYVCGSVSYSEGVNDDLNKMIWGDMDFDFNREMRDSIIDYARTFFYGTDYKRIADALLALELNWVGDPSENPIIDTTYNTFLSLCNEYPQLMKNWRFVLHLFRAQCDKIVRDRRIFENDIVSEAKHEIKLGKTEKAKELLEKDFSDTYKAMRLELDEYAKLLFEQISIQLDVKHFNGKSWERGCTLDTIDNPVTDKRWLLKKIQENNDADYMKDIVNRNIVDHDEYYFSFAEHGFDVIGKQDGEFYMDFCGDSNFDADLPMCMTKCYDHFNFKCSVAGLTASDYILRISYKDRVNEKTEHHKITINGKTLYEGKQFGGMRDKAFEKKYSAPGFLSVVYEINKDYFVNGCADIEISESLCGFEFCEFWITKNKK